MAGADGGGSVFGAVLPEGCFAFDVAVGDGVDVENGTGDVKSGGEGDEGEDEDVFHFLSSNEKIVYKF